MKIWFIEAELLDRGLMARELAAHELHVADCPSEVSADAEIVSPFIYSEIDAPFLEGHPDLRLVATRSTTCDHIDLAACARHGVQVRTVPSYGDHIVPEHAFALLLAVARRLRPAMQTERARPVRHELLRGFEIRGKTLGLIGLGRVGRGMVPIAHGFGMTVIAHDPQVAPAMGRSLGVEGVSLDELFRRSDIVSLHAPLTPATFHLLDRAAFAKCRRGVVIINTARGRLIDTAALVEAMDAGIVGGVGLDVLGEEGIFSEKASHIISGQIVTRLRGAAASDAAAAHASRRADIGKLLLLENLLSRPTVVFTPHVAFDCHEAIERMNRATLQNIQAFIGGAPAPAMDERSSRDIPKTLDARAKALEVKVA